MKAGMVTQIRVNPADCQSVLDIMGIVGIDPYDGRSFAQCVSIAFSSMIGSLKKSGIIEEPDSFQYMNRMATFVGSRNDKRKYVASEALYRNASQGMATPTLPTAHVPHPGQYVPDTVKVQGWTTHGPVDSAAVPMQADPMVRQAWEEEYMEMANRYEGESSFTKEELTRFLELGRWLGYNE